VSSSQPCGFLFASLLFFFLFCFFTLGNRQLTFGGWMDGWMGVLGTFSLGHWLRCVTLSEPDRERVGRLLQSTDQLTVTTSGMDGTTRND
jgi:hypothetical protein